MPPVGDIFIALQHTPVRVVESGLLFDQRRLIRPVAINLVRAGEYERRLRTVIARRDKQVVSQSVYESRNVSIRAGDVVIDCGAHVGLFTRYALRQGASRVIAIEPNPANVACIRANLAAEIESGQVEVVPAGVWDQRKRLPLFVSEESSDAHTFVSASDGHSLVPHSSESRGAKAVLVLPLDEIVDQLALDRVDFVKMDIEGAERKALQGARKTLVRFKPRMAICVYHRDDDPVVVPRIIQETRADYRVHGKLIETRWGKVRSKVLYFD